MNQKSLDKKNNQNTKPKYHCNPLDADSTLNRDWQKSAHWNWPEETEVVKLNSPVDGVSEKKHPTGKTNKYQEIDEEFDKKYTRISKGGEDEGQYRRRWFVRETTSEELLDFIHKLIDNNNKEWERKIKAIENISDFADSGDTLKKRIINNLLK